MCDTVREVFVFQSFDSENKILKYRGRSRVLSTWKLILVTREDPLTEILTNKKVCLSTRRRCSNTVHLVPAFELFSNSAEPPPDESGPINLNANIQLPKRAFNFTLDFCNKIRYNKREEGG